MQMAGCWFVKAISKLARKGLVTLNPKIVTTHIFEVLRRFLQFHLLWNWIFFLSLIFTTSQYLWLSVYNVWFFCCYCTVFIDLMLFSDAAVVWPPGITRLGLGLPTRSLMTASLIISSTDLQWRTRGWTGESADVCVYFCITDTQQGEIQLVQYGTNWSYWWM